MVQADHKPGKPRLLRDLYKHGNSGNSVQPQGKCKQNSFSSIKYLHSTARSWASNTQSLVNFRDGNSALVTCYIDEVDVD